MMRREVEVSTYNIVFVSHQQRGHECDEGDPAGEGQVKVRHVYPVRVHNTCALHLKDKGKYVMSILSGCTIHVRFTLKDKGKYVMSILSGCTIHVRFTSTGWCALPPPRPQK